MLCTSCVHWTVELFSYSALEERWTKLIGNVITPGYKDKFIKESEKQSLDFDNTYLSFKYCSKGCLDRFYIMRNPRDDKPKKMVATCSSYSTSAAAKEGIPVPGPLWTICTTESHGATRIGGQLFYPGLYENSTYFRIPAHSNILPELNASGNCVICNSSFDHGIRIQEVSHFCCNKHYLEWWRARNPEMFKKLNKD